MENKNTVLVIGDIILDQYYYGKVSRISPEAPIPVVKVKNTEYSLGGAANVANNVAALGQKVGLAGLAGDDSYFSILRQILEKKGIICDSIRRGSQVKTNVKLRIVGNHQQIVRLDYNDDDRPSELDLSQFVSSMREVIAAYDAVVLSDYAKGVCSSQVCQSVIKLCRDQRKIVIVDPKGTDWEKYKGADMITPNMKELSEYAGIEIENEDSCIEEKCRHLWRKLDVENLLITRSEKGMTLINQGGISHIPSEAKEVYDVSGAGDTVVAALAVYYGKKDLSEVIKLANSAAGIAVSKKGTAAVYSWELEDRLRSDKETDISRKIVTIEKAETFVNEWKKSGKKVVFTNGCFDLFHRGHVSTLYRASGFGDRLLVAVNSNQSVRGLKGKERPVNDEYDRAYVIASLGCVDAVMIFSEATPERILKRLRPDVLVKGGDYQSGEIAGERYAGTVKLVPYLEGYSTTKLLRKIIADGESRGQEGK